MGDSKLQPLDPENTIVLRLVVPRAFVLPEVPNINKLYTDKDELDKFRRTLLVEGESEDEKSKQKTSDHEKSKLQKKLNEILSPKEWTDEPETKLRMAEKKYTLSDENIRIGLRVIFVYGDNDENLVRFFPNDLEKLLWEKDILEKKISSQKKKDMVESKDLKNIENEKVSDNDDKELERENTQQSSQKQPDTEESSDKKYSEKQRLLPKNFNYKEVEEYHKNQEEEDEDRKHMEALKNGGEEEIEEKVKTCGKIFGGGEYVKPNPPNTKYGLTYFPSTYRVQFCDIEINAKRNFENSYVKFEFYGILKDDAWLIAEGTTKNDNWTPKKKEKKNDKHFGEWLTDWAKTKDKKPEDKKKGSEDKKKGTIKLKSICVPRFQQAYEDRNKLKFPDIIDTKTNKPVIKAYEDINPQTIFTYIPQKKRWEMKKMWEDEKDEEEEKKDETEDDKKRKTGFNIAIPNGREEIEGREDKSEEKEIEIISWAKVSIRALTVDQADRQKWTPLKNEYPILPNHDGIEDMVIQDKHNTLASLLHFWAERDQETSKEVEEFALMQCGPNEFEDILETCLLNAEDPIATAMRASAICDERKSRKNSSGVDWDDNKNKAIDWATKLAEKIPNQLGKLHMTRYYSEAGKLIIDENLDLAVENKYYSVCKNPVFMERLQSRWMLKEDKGSSVNLPDITLTQKLMRKKISPCCWFVVHGIFYLIFVGLLSYSLASSDSAIFTLAFKNQLTSIYFDDAYQGIGTYDDFWNWMQNTVLTNTFPEANTSRLNTKLFLATPEVTLRQFRVAPFTDGCVLRYNMSCYPSIDRASIENGILGLDGNNQTWKNTTWADIEHMGPVLNGLHFRYPPGGYMALISGNQNESSAALSQLQQDQWLDIATRAVIVEFAMFSLSGNLFAVFEILVEYTHVNVVSLSQEITVIDNQPFDPRRGDWVILGMFIFVLGYILQEGCELLATCITINKELNHEKKRQAVGIHHDRYESFFHSPKRAYGHIKSRLPIWGKALTHTLVEHFTDFWNIMDAVTNTALFIYVVIFCLVSIPGSDKRVPDPTDVSLSALWEMRFLIEISKIFGAIGVILAYFRLLYYFIPIRTIGPLVISMLRMYINVGYFIALLAFMILGFSAAFNLIYGGIVPEFTGFGMAIYQCINIAYNQQFFVPNDEFVQLPIHWAGDILMVIYLVLSAILLVNLLIAMMSTTYSDLMQDDQPIIGKWSVAHGDLLLHYERFPFFPPPFLFIQAFIFVVAAMFSCSCCSCCSKKKFSWILVGHWTSQGRLVDRLFEEEKLGREKHDEDPNNKSEKKIRDNDPHNNKSEKKKIRATIDKKKKNFWEHIRPFIKRIVDKKKEKEELKLPPPSPRDGATPRATNSTLYKPIHSDEKVNTNQRVSEGEKESSNESPKKEKSDNKKDIPKSKTLGKQGTDSSALDKKLAKTGGDKASNSLSGMSSSKDSSSEEKKKEEKSGKDKKSNSLSGVSSSKESGSKEKSKKDKVGKKTKGEKSLRVSKKPESDKKSNSLSGVSSSKESDSKEKSKKEIGSSGKVTKGQKSPRVSKKPDDDKKSNSLSGVSSSKESGSKEKSKKDKGGEKETTKKPEDKKKKDSNSLSGVSSSEDTKVELEPQNTNVTSFSMIVMEPSKKSKSKSSDSLEGLGSDTETVALEPKIDSGSASPDTKKKDTKKKDTKKKDTKKKDTKKSEAKKKVPSKPESSGSLAGLSESDTDTVPLEVSPDSDKIHSGSASEIKKSKKKIPKKGKKIEKPGPKTLKKKSEEKSEKVAADDSSSSAEAFKFDQSAVNEDDKSSSTEEQKQEKEKSKSSSKSSKKSSDSLEGLGSSSKSEE